MSHLFLFCSFVGYIRIVVELAAVYFVSSDYVIASQLFLIRCVLDLVDGRSARYFNQCKLGHPLYLPSQVKTQYLQI